MKVLLVHAAAVLFGSNGRMGPDVSPAQAKVARDTTVNAVLRDGRGFDRVLVAVSPEGTPWRHAIDPTWREHSEHAPELYDALDGAVSDLRERGCHVIEAPPFADGTVPSARDVIASMVRAWREPGPRATDDPTPGQLVIMSGRPSIAALIDDAAGVSMLAEVRGKWTKIDAAGLKTWKKWGNGRDAKVGVPRAQYTDFAALTSIDGIGPVTARALLLAHKSPLEVAARVGRNEPVPELDKTQRATVAALGMEGMARALEIARLRTDVPDVGALLSGEMPRKERGDGVRGEGGTPSGREPVPARRVRDDVDNAAQGAPIQEQARGEGARLQERLAEEGSRSRVRAAAPEAEDMPALQAPAVAPPTPPRAVEHARATNEETMHNDTATNDRTYDHETGEERAAAPIVLRVPEEPRPRAPEPMILRPVEAPKAEPPPEPLVTRLRTSQAVGALCDALAAAQGEIEAAERVAENPHLRKRYADLAAVWRAIRLPLSKHGLAVVQVVTGGHLVTRLCKGDQWIESDVKLSLDTATGRTPVQALGSAITYLRRYVLSGLVGVAPDDDDDGNAATQGQQQRPAAAQGGPRR